MKILILSDSHYFDIGNIDYSNYNYKFHAGDYGNSRDILEDNNFIFVKGNCDLYGDKERFLEINNKKILLIHGDLYNVKYDYYRLVLKAKSLNTNYVFFGHTHIQTYFEENNIVFVNPGAYEDGYYAIITDDKIEFYRFNVINKVIHRKW